MRNVLGVWLSLVVVAALALGALFSIPAWADDELITACDGGSASCVLDTNPGASTARLNWTMTVRCETDPARYSMSIDAGACSVASKSLKLDADRTFDLDVNKSQGSRTAPKRYVCFALDDGGIPQCAIYKQPN
jgi:hypothetical protein